MRSTSTLLFLIFFCPSLGLATQVRVNNNPGMANEVTIHSSLVDVLANHVVVGDSILLEHSDTPYDGGNVTVSIQVRIFGTGFFLGDNDCTQADLRTAKIDELTIEADLVLVSGIEIGRCSIEADFVRVNRCNISEYLGLGTTGSINTPRVGQNFIEGSNAGPILDIVDVTNYVIKNNFIHNTNTSGSHNMRVTDGSGVILNNLFFGTPDNLIHNAVVQNNYFEDSEIMPASSSLTVSFNLARSTFLDDWGGAVNNNYGGSAEHEPDSVYCFTLMDGVSRDAKYQLNAWNTDPNSGNPATNAGADGNDIGMFSGVKTYILSGMPGLPSVAKYSGSVQGTQGGGSNAVVKAKSRR
ncbi:MAG: hypothetical protein ACI84C_001532 [Flavobacteriales bacterium]|jgi:hypothetical protein